MTDSITIIKLDAQVKDVTLMEDRARVVRKGNATLQPGMTRILVEGVSPVISDKTVLGRIAGGNAQVISTQVCREHREVADLHEADPEAIGEKITNKQTEANRIQARMKRVDEEIDALSELERRALEEMGYDSSWNQADPELWSAQLGEIRKQSGEFAAEFNKLRDDARKLEKEMEALYAEQATASSITETFVYRIESLVEAKEEGDYQFSFDYVVPSACWRPCHTATLTQGGEDDSLKLQAEGCVWQNTGEDWNDVQLHFSTQRPSLGVEPPELDVDLLHVQKKPETLVVQTREQDVQDAGMGQAASTSNEMPGIDDGGEPLNLKSQGLATVPSDGLPYRVKTFTMTTKTKTSYLCTPELTLAVLLKSDQPNTSPHPLLAGPVDLIRTSGKVGNTALEFIAPHEAFELGWGADPELRVKRWDSTGQAESKMLSSWEAKKHTIHVRISNIGADPRKILLKERIPVSEIEEVEIDFHADESTGDAKPDENGFLTWNVTIEPFGQYSCDLAYTVRKKKNVVGV